MAAIPPETEARLKTLQRDYARRLPDRGAEIRTLFNALAANWKTTDAMELRRMAHNLAGSGASYGFPEVSQSARRLERALDAALASAESPAPGLRAAVGVAVDDLIAATESVRAD